jgi:hypothetical protein
MTYSINSYRLLALAALVGLGSSFAACSSDSPAAGPTDIDASSGTGGKSSSTGGASNAGGKTSNGGGGATATTGGAGNDTDSGTGGASPTDGGGGTGGGSHPTDASMNCKELSTTTCLECPYIPTTDTEFLNHCGLGVSGCIKFTTTSTVPAKADLPAIP